ncbi:MAG TPA: GNAT family N-acetyltransferase, partial [Anaerolineales bacterium]
AEPGDYEAVHKIFQGTKAVRGTLQLPFPWAESWRKRLAEPGDGNYFLVACAGDEAIGQIGVHTFPSRPSRRHVGQIGMAVRDDRQGKGVGSALMQAAIDLAENWLQLTRIELEVYTDNQAGVRLYEKFGFKIEGTLKQFAFRDGEFVDAYFMARLRTPSEQVRKEPE